MKKFASILALTLVVLVNTVSAQSGIYVASGAKIYFAGDSATMFSNLTNKGNIGVAKSAVVNFKGNTWTNDSKATITDESADGLSGKGGVIRFIDSVQQKIAGGYNAATKTGAAFSNLQIENKAGVQLIDGSAKVKNELTLAKGKLFINDNILVVGNGNPGKINGYDSTRFIVMNNSLNQGYLLREGVTKKDSLVVFPVGSTANTYAPAAIRTKSDVADNFYVNVADGVKHDMIRGDVKSSGVNKTWQIGKELRPNKDEVEISLQHINAEEGVEYTKNKNTAYVSQYMDRMWDEIKSQNTGTTGNLTTGSAIASSTVNTRSFTGTIGSTSYFTKLTGGKGDTSKLATVLTFNGVRLDTNNVRLFWKTNPEINNSYFIVQRRLANEANFSNIDTVATKSVNGFSLNDLNYELIDKNNYSGLSFYRLVLVSNTNTISYSNTIVIGGFKAKSKIQIWPIPTPDKFYIGFNGQTNVKNVIIYNAIGQLIWKQAVNGRSIMEVSGFIPGTYMVSFITDDNKLLETRKVLVIGH